MPSLALLTTNALACADKVIIPIQSEFLAEKRNESFNVINIASKKIY